MKKAGEAQADFEREIGRLVITLSELDGLVYPCKPLLFGEFCSKSWASKTCKQRIDAVQERIRRIKGDQRCEHLTELSGLLDEAKPLLELRNMVAHNILTFEPSMLNLSHGEFSMWDPDTNSRLSSKAISQASGEGRQLLYRIFDCLSAHGKCVPDNYPEDIEQALDPP